MICQIPRAVCFVCNHEGIIQTLLRDDINLFASIPLPSAFISIFDFKSKPKSQEFWEVLIRESTIFDWELNANTTPLPEMFKFSGFVTKSEVLITASKHNDALESMFNELMKMNNEQHNLLRHSEKSLTTLKKGVKNNEVGLLNKMSVLNNEMVNTQRELVKKNAEVNRLNKKLQSINTDLEQFTYIASHDLKEPLRMVTSFMQLVKNQYGSQLDNKAHSYINFAIEGGLRMQKMIGDLLELSRTGRQEGSKEWVDLNDIISKVKQNIFKLVEESHAQIIINTPLPVLFIFNDDITRLLQNLVSNAIKFRKKEIFPVIRIDVLEEENEWLFSVQDNSIGIKEDKLEKVFEIFTQLNSKGDYEGSGIGLAVCKKVIENAGGRIWVESEEGKGSTFYFTIRK